MKTARFAPALAFLMVLALPLRAEDEPTQKSSLWMRQKLQASQAILRGLADADFDSIGKDAQAMNLMTYLEEWTRADTPGYQAQLRLFEFADHELIRAAREKNIDAATLAYTQLTISCVSCHKIVRDAK
jgi:cytochrome c556